MIAKWRIILVVSALAVEWASASAQPVLVPSNLVVSLSASPNSNLSTGQPIILTIAVTNLGPDPVTSLVLDSSTFTNQFLFTQPVTCVGMVVSVAETPTGPENNLNWYVTGLAGEPVFAVGQTMSCSVTIALTAAAPARYPFTFGLATYNTDLNPGDGTKTVILQRTVEAVPVQTPFALLLIIICAVGGARASLRRSES